MKRLRIAFLTDEFPTESPAGGGLASYLDRITATLVDLGHEVEVITRSFRGPAVVDWNGVRVESVLPRDFGLAGWRRHAARWKWRLVPRETRGRLRTALALAHAFERRSAERPFDFVQSTNCSLSGLFVARRPGRRHVVRMSSSRALWQRADGVRVGPDDWCVAHLERRLAQHADAVYAPSRFLADHLRRLWRADVAVLRPPGLVDPKPAAEPPAALPERFLLHFGTLRRRKGSALLAEALPRAWAREPEVCMLWAGRESPPGSFERWRTRWGAHARSVRHLGALERPDLRAVIARARACVLPSLADNLPNTAIESLALGVPVIGSSGASLDELVEDGHSGELVALGDADALADAIVRCWRGEVPWIGAGFRPPASLAAMAPAAAAESLVHFAMDEDPR